MKTLFSLKEAAEYLDLHPQTIRGHIYGKNVTNGRYIPPSGLFEGKGQIIGRSWVFTRNELDAVKNERARRKADRRRRWSDNPPPVQQDDGRYQCPGCARIVTRQGWHNSHKKSCEIYKKIQEHQNGE